MGHNKLGELSWEFCSAESESTHSPIPSQGAFNSAPQTAKPHRLAAEQSSTSAASTSFSLRQPLLGPLPPTQRDPLCLSRSRVGDRIGLLAAFSCWW